MVKEAEKYKPKMNKLNLNLNLLIILKHYYIKQKSSLENKNYLTNSHVQDKKTINDLVKSSEAKWFDLNRASCTKEEIDTKHEKLKSAVMPIMSKLYPYKQVIYPHQMKPLVDLLLMKLIKYII